MTADGIRPGAAAMPPDDRRIRLASGTICVLRHSPLPLLSNYHVLFIPHGHGSPSDEDEHQLYSIAQDIGEELGQRFYGDPGCYALIFSGPRTRRRPWPHVHILPARDLAEKRRAMLLYFFKRFLTRWLA